MGFNLFMLYTISFFLRLPERFSFLGVIRFDYILGITLLLLAFPLFISKESNDVNDKSYSTGLLIGILVYVIITIPLVQWPGTVLGQGIPDFLKNIVFYIFAVIFIKDDAQLKKYINLYLILLVIIVLEPLYYYSATGSMGYIDHSMGKEAFTRLTGTTSKVGGNPNGLASVVAITIPIIFFLFKYYKLKIVRILILAYLPLSLVTLILTGSRSGLLSTAVAVALCIIKGRAVIKGVIITIIIVSVALAQMDDIYKQRYLSIVDSTAQGRSGADLRLTGLNEGFDIFLERPILGHGLGTYKEANWNLKKEALASHDLYVGVLVELGILGFIIYFLFILSIFNNTFKIKKNFVPITENTNYLQIVANTLESVLITQLVFSVFAGGPSYYIWFLLGGISVAALRIANTHKNKAIKCA